MSKLVLFGIFSGIMSLVFIAVGIYFLSERFLEKLNESSPVKTEEAFKKNKFRSKGCGLVSLSLGFLTVVWIAIIFTFPAMLTILALIYMFIILDSVIALMYIMK